MLGAGQSREVQAMGTASLVLSIVGIIITIVGFVPLLGWLNWFGVVILALALLFGFIGIFPSGGRGKAVAGMIISVVFLVIALLRLGIGGGVL